MAFKVSASDFQEIMDYINTQCPGSNLDITIEPNESKLYIKTSNRFSDMVTISVTPADVSSFPTLTKSMRLKDDK